MNGATSSKNNGGCYSSTEGHGHSKVHSDNKHDNKIYQKLTNDAKQEYCDVRTNEWNPHAE